MSEANIWQPRTVIDVLRLVPITDAAATRSITYPADKYAAISMVNGAGAVVTINLDSVAPFLDGEHFTVSNDSGTGQLQFVPAAGVTLLYAATGDTIGAGQAASFVHMGPNLWRMFSGDSVSISADLTTVNAAIAANEAAIAINLASIGTLAGNLGSLDSTVTALSTKVEYQNPGLVLVSGSRTLTTTDISQTLDVANTAELTVPSNLGVKDGNMIQVLTGVGATLTLTPAAGVTVMWLQGGTVSSGGRTVDPGSAITLVRKSATLWQLFGNGIS